MSKANKKQVKQIEIVENGNQPTMDFFGVIKSCHQVGIVDDLFIKQLITDLQTLLPEDEKTDSALKNPLTHNL